MLHPDYDSKLLLDMINGACETNVEGARFNIAMMSADELALAREMLNERKSMVESGLLKVLPWFHEVLRREVDSRLRVWWNEWKQCWTLDRLQDAGVAELMTRMARDSKDAEAKSLMETAAMLGRTGPYYLTLAEYPAKTELDRAFIETLKASDMSRYSPAELMAMKQAEANKVKARNAKQSEENVRAIVDGMSSKAIKQFIEVTDAIRTGETIIAQGEDANVLARINEDNRRAARAAEDAGEQLHTIPTSRHATNPGQHPVFAPERKRAEQ